MTDFKCKVGGCLAHFHKAKGFCVHHYVKSRYEAAPQKPETAWQCKQADCTAKFHSAKGWCKQHYQASRSGKQSLCEFEGQHSNNMAIVPVDGKVCCIKHYAEGIGLVAVKTPD